MSTWKPIDLELAHAHNLEEILNYAATHDIVLTPTGDEFGGIDDQGWINLEHVQDLGDLLEKTGPWSWRISEAGRRRLAVANGWRP
ncbi:hypothetical protein [Catenuloplanes indicus]|uniref:Uncharacterized protein n=1 Tax=Catenuloplanes indicus TaxID=137267 RepID=A0AAE3W8T6_9ACTN|nr:hypothetical protein [Catenuloplanes indicus]MDQ0363342.1 hypothetical protein [Catenuloplanes indicus]MDQ0371664.1 hypothetical protein [Catenuloplanes indicus]